MAVDFNGTWEWDSNENLDVFMKSLGCGPQMIQMALAQKATIVVKQKGDDFVITTTRGPKTREIQFKVGEEYKEPLVLRGDKDFRMIATWEGTKLVTKNLDDPEYYVTYREIEDGKYVQTQVRPDGTSCRRFYKRV